MDLIQREIPASRAASLDEYVPISPSIAKDCRSFLETY